jgi:hypothetical protein
MDAYVVRFKKDRRLVGIFVCNNLQQLVDLVEENDSEALSMDPDECEYAELPVGGLKWPGSSAFVPIQADRKGIEEADYFAEEVEMTNSWHPLFRKKNMLSWTDL